MKRKLTVNDLNKLGACVSQVRKFQRKWPNGVYITVENILEAGKAGFDLSWFMARAINGRKWAKHDRHIDKIWSEWFQSDTMTLAEYDLNVAVERVRALREDWSPEPRK